MHGPLLGIAISIGREPKSGFVQFFNSKLGRIAVVHALVLKQPILELIRPPLVFPDYIIEIKLEQAPLVFLFYFISAFDHVKSLLIMGPNNTKTHH